MAQACHDIFVITPTTESSDMGQDYAEFTVAQMAANKEKSRRSPDGSCYLDHILELIRGIAQPLPMVLCADGERFEGVPVRIYWRQYTSSDGLSRRPSELLVDVPDEIYRRVQSRYAAEFLQRYFGFATACSLPLALRPRDEHDDTRTSRWLADDTITLIENDWGLFKTAVRETAASASDYLGGASLRVASRSNGPVSVRAHNDSLELMLREFELNGMRTQWVTALSASLGVSRF